MIYYVDIDDTICETTGLDYSKSIPRHEMILKINKLYDEGHTIIYWTARGTMTGIDWSVLTTKQFAEWGVKHHELKFGKPAYDIIVCDKSKRIEEI
jgi:hypothetical protein